jgi:hypothetical protein
MCLNLLGQGVIDASSNFHNWVKFMDNDEYPSVATPKAFLDSPIQAHRLGAEQFVDQLHIPHRRLPSLSRDAMSSLRDGADADEQGVPKGTQMRHMKK